MANYRGWARIVEDVNSPDWCFKSRSNPTNQCTRDALKGITLPQAYRTFRNPSSFKLDEVAGGAWQRLCEMIDPADAVKYINRLGSGWRNQGAPWQMECLSFSRNVVYVTNLNDLGDKAFVLGLDVTQSPSAALWEYGRTIADYNYTTSPHLLHVFTAVTPDDKTVLASYGDPKHDGQIYIFPMQNYQQRFMETKDLEFFPLLPLAASVIVGGLNVRREPAGEILRVAPQGEQFTVLEFRPRGSAVWGRISDGWVALVHPGIDDWYSTSFRMKTLPPPL